MSSSHRYGLDAATTVLAYVGRGADEATRERAVRIGLIALDLLPDGKNTPRREFDRERLIVEAWLAAKPGSPERAKAVERARRIGTIGGPAGILCGALHLDPASHAGAAVQSALRGYRPDHSIPALEKALVAAGFNDTEDL